MSNYDIAVIGAGPGGYVAAIRGAQLGLKTVIIESNHMGGICLNWGCIPTKALLKSAQVYQYTKKSEKYGVEVSSSTPNLDKIVERSRGVSKKLSSGIAGLMKKNKIDVIDGYATFIDSKTLSIKKDKKEIQRVTAKNFIIATGARARHLPNFEGDGKLIWTYREALVPDAKPEKLLVVGSGAIGSEFASFYNDIDCDVTLMEVLDRILPNEDEEISKIATKAFKGKGIKIKTKIKLNKFDKKKNSVVVEYEEKGKKQTEEYDRVIMAVGVVPNTDKIGLENAKVKKDDRGIVEVSPYLETSKNNIYAIGDIVQGPWLAHKASHEGIIAVEHIAKKLGKFNGKPHPIDRLKIPGCTYTAPEVASVGLTEAKAKEQGYDIKVGRFPFIGNGKAIASGDEENGMIKTIFDKKTGELLGAHMIGNGVTEMVSSFLVGKQMEGVEQDFMETIFPHPTTSEAIHEAVLDAFDRVIHI